jgi:hypothetical protein
MKRFLVAVSASLLLILALVAPVGAAGPGCSDFGAASAAGGQNARPFGQLVSFVAHGGLAPAYDGVSDLVHAEHSTMCAQP